MNIIQIAKICHDANRSYCQTLGDNSQCVWETASDWQRSSAIAGVNYAITNPNSTAKDQHDSWMADKVADGWTYGPVKSAINKQHPCIVPYDELPEEQKIKDHLFRAIVTSLKQFVK